MSGHTTSGSVRPDGVGIDRLPITITFDLLKSHPMCDAPQNAAEPDNAPENVPQSASQTAPQTAMAHGSSAVQTNQTGKTGEIPLVRMNGLGNKITVLDVRQQAGALREGHLTAGQVQGIANEPGARFDQLMVITPADTSDHLAGIKIYNVDGSIAGNCGNGMRCVGLYMFRDTGIKNQRFAGPAGELIVTFDHPDQIGVDMGVPRLDWQDIPLRDPFYDTTGIELQAGPIDAPILHTPSVCNMGNPHAVFWVDDVDAITLDKMGPLLEHHPIFTEQANITVAQVVTREHARIRTWERGAGLTQACGTAACATLVCGARIGHLERRATISVPGGDLAIQWLESDHVMMTGPAVLEAQGRVHVASDGEFRIEI